VHPSDGPTGHEQYLMCDDLDATMRADSPGSGCPVVVGSACTSRGIRSRSTY